jgi:hypothetical protein
MKKALTIITILSLVILIACSKSGSGSNPSPAPAPIDCGETAKSFVTDVNPIIQTFCASNAGCHNAGSNNGPGELLRYSQIFNARSFIRSAVISGRMPLNGSLTAAQKNAIACWIDNGALEN